MKSANLRENQDEDHADEESRLLRCPTNASVSNNANGVARTQSTEPTSQAGSQMGEALRQCVARTCRLHLALEHHCHHQSVDTNDT